MARGPFARTRASVVVAMSEPTEPFPVRQMLVLAICRICEPIAFTGIFPYVYFMVKESGITDDVNKIGFYASMVTSAFTFAEFSTGFLWGRVSDRIGRKPVILTGLIGTALSVLMFGLARNFYLALAARAIGGFLNGNMGVLQSTIAEMITVKEHRPRAYTVLPVVWGMGSIIGPVIGGALANPCEHYPAMFPRGSIWDTYPYLLPNVFSAFIVVIGVVTGILFLEETHAGKKQCRDRGLELGKWIVSKLPLVQDMPERDHPRSKYDELRETEPLLASDEPLPGYQTTENSPANSPLLRTTPSAAEPQDSLSLNAEPAFTSDAPSRIFTRPVVLNVAAFGILAFHTMTFDSLLPTFLSTDMEAELIFPPFKFVGGFGFDERKAGVILSCQGLYGLVINMTLVPMAISRVGPLRLFRFLAVSYFMLYLLTPYLVLLPETLRTVGLCIILVWKNTFAAMSYPSNAILTADSSPSPYVLGTINGVAASTASLCRGFGPLISGMLYTIGLQTGYSGLAWWFSALVTLLGAYVALQLPNQQPISEKQRDDIEAQPPSTT